ncbi:uncharacterized protein LOC136071786 [Hydra vulgaris]|uniref:Uncharacterized protein LOC136071786 n=1 Tax=Hydra vulgaris TaxID=6087 RepID=A0ABM4BUS2_HYDVU
MKLHEGYADAIAMYVKKLKETELYVKINFNHNLSMGWKGHIIEHHLINFLNNIRMPLGIFAEQCSESVHHNMLKTLIYHDLLELIVPASKVFEGNERLPLDILARINQTNLELELKLEEIDTDLEFLGSYVSHSMVIEGKHNLPETLSDQFSVAGDKQKHPSNRKYIIVNLDMTLIDVDRALCLVRNIKRKVIPRLIQILYINSFFVEKIEHNYSTTLNAFYDEFMVSFVLFLYRNQQINIIDIFDGNGYALRLDIFEDFLIVKFIESYSMKTVTNTWNLIEISQKFINNTYEITGAVNGTNQFSKINANGTVFTDIFLYLFSDCIFTRVCNYGYIKMLSIYSETQVIWSQWSEWSQCNASCIITRTRSCSNNQLLNCFGNNTEINSCSNIYQVPLAQWNDWSSCNVSYGNGFMKRTLTCNLSNNKCCSDTYELKECFTSFYLENETQLIKGNLVATLSTLFKEYTVSFEVKLTAIQGGPLSVFHLTTNNDCGTYGYRTPAMWVQTPGTFYICSAVNSINDFCQITKYIELNNWNSIKISQQLLEGKYIYSIEHNCTIIFSQENNDSQEFLNVKVYVSDPWYKVQPGFIRNFKITNGKPAQAAIWSQWNDWSNCNDTYGYMNRTRRCNTQNPSDWCCGDNFDMMACYVLWTQWRTWSSSNGSYELINRTRECNVSNTIDWCYGNRAVIVENSAFWTQWNDWSSCNNTYAIRNRMRTCIVLNVMEWCYSSKSESLEFSEVYLMEDETELSKGNIVAIIKKFKKEFSVYFEILPTVFLNGFHNIIQITTGDNSSNYGYRNPGVWFHEKGTGELMICYDINSTTGNCMNTNPLINKSWSTVRISQMFIEGKYMYSTELNGEMIRREQNSDAREFSNVKVYASNSWNEVQRGFIRNLKIINGNPALWPQCSNWSSCNALLGIKNITFNYETINSKKVCYGLNSEILKCFAFWSQWSIWTSCNATYGFMNRTRDCNISNTLDGCYGNHSEIKQCYAFWSQWSNWTSCNSSHGFTSRTKECNSSTIIDECKGNKFEVMECFAFWSQWSNWTSCNATHGFINRTRECNSSNSIYGCYGNSSDVKECFAFWSKWSNWTGCNSTYGFMNRTRECNISNSINQCYGNDTEVMECFVLWGKWSSWTGCNEFNRFMNRSRECKVLNTKEICFGKNSEVIECPEKWTTWSECSVTCGVGNRSKYSQHETIKLIKVESCNQISCPEDGMWGEWNKLECSNTCGKGIHFLSRSCDNPRPSYNGQDCIGVSNYTEVCDNNIICPLNGSWSFWSPWSLCSQPCGGGLHSRFRSCSNPVSKFGGHDCNGSVEEFTNCTMCNCKSVKLSLKVNFIDEMYNDDWYSKLTSTGSLLLKKKIQDAIAKLYSNRKVNFNVVIHSIDNDP